MRRVLVIAFDIAGISVESERRVRIEVVAGTVVRDPWPWIPGAPVSRVCCGVIDPGNPGRSAAPFVGLSFPGLPTRFVWPGHSVRLPESFSGERVKRAYGAPNAELATRVAGDDFAAHRKRRQGRVTTGFIVIDWNSPNLLARSGVKSNERTIGRRHVDVVTVQRDPTVCWMELEQTVRVLPYVSPQLGAGLGVKSYDVILRRRYEHAPVIDDRRRFMCTKEVGAHRPGQRQLVNVRSEERRVGKECR